MQWFLICFSTLFPTQVTPLHLAVRFENSATVVNTLVQAGANVDALNSNQQSPLHLASSGNPALVPVLIAARCKVNLLDRLQQSPLYYAARYSYDRSAVSALMSSAADPHLGNSPLTSSSVSNEMKDYIRSLSNWFLLLTDPMISNDLEVLINKSLIGSMITCAGI